MGPDHQAVAQGEASGDPVSPERVRRWNKLALSLVPKAILAGPRIARGEVEDDEATLHR